MLQLPDSCSPHPVGVGGRDLQDRIAAIFNLSTDEVEALLRYFEEHRAAVTAHHNKIEERNARGNPPEIEERAKAFHAKLLALREEIRRRNRGESNGDRHPGCREHSGARRPLDRGDRVG